MIKLWKLVQDTGIHTRLIFGDATSGHPTESEESKDGLGYFVTLAELREVWEAGCFEGLMRQRRRLDTNKTFNDYMKSKEGES